MSTINQTRPEAIKLARMLRLDAGEPPEYLLTVPARELVSYRNSLAELLYDDEMTLMRRMVDAAPLLPSQMLATVAEKALGPVICARLLGLLAPERAADIAKHLSVGFVAETAAELDPRCAVDVVTAMPDDQVVSIALTLAANREYVAMGRIVTHLPPGPLATTIERLSEEQLLRISFVLDDKSQIKRLAEVVGADRVRQILAGADALGLAEEAEDLCGHLTAAQRKLFGAPAKPTTSSKPGGRRSSSGRVSAAPARV